MPTRVRVVTPASTANLGPGFDCLGLALGLYNSIEMSLATSGPGPGLQIEIRGEGADHLSTGADNLIARAAETIWETVGRRPAGLDIRVDSGIPVGAGLGSSAASIVGGLVAANALAGTALARSDLLRRAFELEGHPDNAAAALFGGLTMVSATGDGLRYATVDVPPLKVAVAVPGIRGSTNAAREALPGQVPLGDAVFNIGRTALVVRALERGDYDLLGWAMTDRLHEPYRRRLIPGCDSAAEAARRAGAAAVCISGAGPSVAAFAPDGHAAIADAMKSAFEASGVSCRTFVLPVDRQGVQVSVVG